MPQYDIEINQGVCVGDKGCQMEAPATFDVSLEGTAFVRDRDGDDAGCVLTAAKKCVFHAITLRDRDTGEEIPLASAVIAHDCDGTGKDDWRWAAEPTLTAEVSGFLGRKALKRKALHRVVGELLLFITGSPPQVEWGDRMGPGWYRSLAVGLSRLRDVLAPHYQEQDEAHVLENLEEQFPHAATQIESLRSKRAELLADLEATWKDSVALACAQPWRSSDLPDRAEKLIHAIASRELSESELVSRLNSEDLGISG